MSASKEKGANKKTNNGMNPVLMQWMKHLGAYIILMLIAMLYFKPVAFDGKSLEQHDNVQAIAMQTEIIKYRELENKEIRWTNQFFGGMPTSLISSPVINYIGYIGYSFRLFQAHNEWTSLFLILFSCYIGLCLMGVNWGLAIALAAVLGFFTSNTLYIAAGHTGKMLTVATVPIVLGGFVYAYRKNLLLGTAAFAMGLSYNIICNHVQMTYYMYFALSIIGLFFLLEAVRENKLPQFTKFATVMIVATLLGVISNIAAIWPNYEYGQESTRGTTELTQKENKSGLGEDYVFGLSMEKMELGTLMFPNFYGGTQGKSFISQDGSQTQTAFRSPKVQQEIAAAAKRAKVGDANQFMNQIASQYTRQYRGSQTMCGGPMYYGAVVCFLFILSLLLLTGALKWGILGSFAFFSILAFGKNFPVVSDLMYNYFPMYAKFRDTKMTLLVAQPLVVLSIGAGLMELVRFNADKYTDTLSAQLLPKLKQTVSRQGYVILAGAIALGICLLAYLYLSMTNLSAPKDNELAVISPSLVAALEMDRAALAKSDIFKAIGFILAAIAVLYFYTKNTFKIEVAGILLAAIACIDLNMVNKEYVNDQSYKTKNYDQVAKEQPPQKSDRDIMKDKSIYHVVDYSRGYPSQNAQACYFHKSMGGYFAAKPLLFQEFWGRYQMDIGEVALKQHSNIMNMLNVKYIILSPERFMDNPTALGNAWFVQNINVVKNADEELAAIDDLDPVLNAVVQERYKDYVNGLNSEYSAGDKIYLKRYHPDTMTYQSETAKDRFAVFSEMYYSPDKGWNVYIDGEKVAPFIKTNYVLRGLKVPAGKHEIKMVFEPNSINVGQPIGAISSLVIILLTLFAIYKHFKEGTTEEEA